MSNFFEEALPVIAATAAAAVGVATGGTSTAITYAALAYSAGSEVSSGMAASDAAKAAAEAQEQQVKTQDLQQQYKISKQQNQEAQLVHEQLAQNEMMAVQHGVSTQSPSFNAIQVDTLRNAQQAMSEGTTASQISKLSASANIENINREESAKQSQIFFGTLGNIAGTVSGAARYGMGSASQAHFAGMIQGQQAFDRGLS
jgi:RAB protein geranylgeranyltransferase component A